MPGKLTDIRPGHLMALYVSVGLLSILMSSVHISSEAADTAIVFAGYLFLVVSIFVTCLGIYRGGEFRKFWFICLILGLVSLLMTGVFNLVYSVFLMSSVALFHFGFA